MKKLLILLSLFGFSGAALADVMVGVNYLRGDDYSTALAPADAAGVVSHANWHNDTWNGSPLVNLTDSEGNATGINITPQTPTASGTWHNQERGVVALDSRTGADNKLMSGWIAGRGNDLPATITFSGALGVGAFETYDVYIYFANSGYTSYVTDGSTTKYFTDAPSIDYDNKSKFIEITSTSAGSATAGNYAVFSGSGTDDFTLSVGVDSTTGSDRQGIHGVQIVGTAIPEPATLGLIALSSCGILAIRRVFMI